MIPRLAVLVSVLGLAFSSAASAADPHHHHVGGGYGFVVQPQVHHNHVLVAPTGQVVSDHYDNYRYVVPATRPTFGTYYTHQNTQYYTPPAQVVQGRTAYSAPTAVPFGGHTRFEDLSGRLETMINEVCLDLHYNYSHNPGFAEAYQEAYGMLQQAKALHAAEHAQDRNYLRTTVQSLDALMHHVSGEALQFSPQFTKRIGAYSLPDKLAQVESTVHHLMHDVGIEPHAEANEVAPPPGAVEQAPPPGGRPVFGSPPPNSLPSIRP